MSNSNHYDTVIIGTGPAGFGAAFHLIEKKPDSKILMLEKESFSTGGLRNDCKMNFTYPIGFPLDNWSQDEADHYLEMVEAILKPDLMSKKNLRIYEERAKTLGVNLLNIRQSHLGTDGGLQLIKDLCAQLEKLNVTIKLGIEAQDISTDRNTVVTTEGDFIYDHLIVAPGRHGFQFLQKMMNSLGIYFIDNVVDIGIRVETRMDHYPIVKDYYDPKFHFPGKVRTFCTNSGSAYVVQEKYHSQGGQTFYR